MKLKGMTWSHERGIKPLLAASEAFNKIHPEVTIEWDARSLADFELFPLEQLADAYDFIMIDHPHIGTAYAENLLMPLDKFLSPEFIADQEENSVGLSHKSYFWEGHQWAIAADSAAQVSAYREDVLADLNIVAPIDWEEVFTLVGRLKGKYSMAIPFVPVHAYSSFFTLGSQFSQRVFWSDGSPLDVEVGVAVLKHLEKVLSLSHPDSFDMDPINMLDRMATGEEIVYCPQVYGYSTYSMEGYKGKVVKFNDIASDTGKPEGSMIGGVGLSITSSCKNTDMAIEFIKMTTSETYQKTEFAENFGQPGHRIAWQDDVVNSKTKDFYKDTLATLDYGSMRPRFNGYIGFQAEAGARIREFIKEKRSDYTAFINELNGLFADFYSKREA